MSAPIAPPPADTPVDAQCANCKHSPAYHDGDGGRPCRAWAPDDAATTDVCPCQGWKAKVVAVAEESKPWGWERKDLQGDEF